MARLSGAEVCAEYVWLVDNGMSVPLACETLGKTLSNMERQLARYGYTGYTSALSREQRYERTIANEREKCSA